MSTSGASGSTRSVDVSVSGEGDSTGTSGTAIDVSVSGQGARAGGGNTADVDVSVDSSSDRASGGTAIDVSVSGQGKNTTAVDVNVDRGANGARVSTVGGTDVDVSVDTSVGRTAGSGGVDVGITQPGGTDSYGGGSNTFGQPNREQGSSTIVTSQPGDTVDNSDRITGGQGFDYSRFAFQGKMGERKDIDIINTYLILM